VVHFYGAAEVDASCLAAMERTPEGELVYYATSPEVRVELDDSRLLLGLVGAAGETIAERFDTGDCARPVGEGYVVWNHERVSPDVVRELEGWSFSEWARRTGYLRAGRERAFQLREGIRPDRAPELDFFEFGGRFGFSWLEKPKWSLSA
jgi:hypothetical protein